ncbi:MAG TPA: hypothetical protein VNO50_10920 [Pyrinomonadaceae bacterium]|nr:hypothetical protein [Pyrinomonadaceae bacterium]
MDLKSSGESVTTRVATDLEADDVSGGFTASDATSTPYTITLDKELGKAHSFTQAELSKGGMDLLRRTFLPSIVNAVGKGVIKEVVKLIMNGTFANKTTVAAAAFTADTVAAIATALNNLNVPDSERFGILKPSYYGNLATDDIIQGVNTSGSSEALREHQVRRLSGFDLAEFNGFPTTGTTADENLHGFFGSREALLIAARFPTMPDQGNDVVDVENLIEPETGFPLQFQMFYVPKERKWYIALATLFGVKAGVPNNLHRIVSV